MSSPLPLPGCPLLSGVLMLLSASSLCLQGHARGGLMVPSMSGRPYTTSQNTSAFTNGLAPPVMPAPRINQMPPE